MKKPKHTPTKSKPKAPTTPKKSLLRDRLVRFWNFLRSLVSKMGTNSLKKVKSLWRDFAKNLHSLLIWVCTFPANLLSEVLRFFWSLSQLPLDLVRFYRMCAEAVFGLWWRKRKAAFEVLPTQRVDVTICKHCGAHNPKAFVKEYRVNVVRGADRFDLPTEAFAVDNFQVELVSVYIDDSLCRLGEDYELKGTVVQFSGIIGVPKKARIEWWKCLLGKRGASSFRPASVFIRVEGKNKGAKHG